MRAGMLLSDLYDRHLFIRLYLSLLLKIAPPKYKRLLKTKKVLGLFCAALVLFAFARG
jgi:hypothetical protein